MKTYQIFFDSIEYVEYIETEEDLKLEKEMFLKTCGSCLNFIFFYAESGFL